MLRYELVPFLMAIQEAWVCVHHGGIQQELWAEEWECPSALPCQAQGIGGCPDPVVALWPGQDTLAWVVLVQWQDP